MPRSHFTPAMADIETFTAGRIRELRRARGASQAALAGLIGVSYQQLQKYESGETTVSAPVLYVLARALGVGLDEFFEGLPAVSVDTLPRRPSRG